MQYNPGDGSGIVDEIDSLCDSDSVSYPIATKTRRVNTALEDLISMLINASGTWQFDDTNYLTLPIGMTDMIAGQSAYQFATEFLQIELVQIMDNKGFWHIIRPVDQEEQPAYSLDNFDAGGITGFPYMYDKEGAEIILYPAPSAAYVTLSQGLKVKFKRTARLFAVTDTTIQPGFASPYHILVPKMAALPFCKTYKPDRVPQLNADIIQGKADMIKFYANRQRDSRSRLQARKTNGR